MIEHKYAKEYSSAIEPNILESPYLDLVVIQNGTYHNKNVLKSVARDAGVLFDAVREGDIDVIRKMSTKYHKAFLTSKKRGQDRDRFVPVDMAKVRMFNLSVKYTSDFVKYMKQSCNKMHTT